ncbi:TetR family transcriptional regulator [Streptomyces californicus]|uniref:TetR family transcriptional regulator n=1 Tax=Streptomyces californicus TaxID=67351 RepID=A0ABD7D871_9ACTN|nr:MULTISPECIES: TetR family transcriptional regulator [Streptomyces]QRV32325.1 TetR family transcriptional regulator [Streptomyces californicus]QRV38523.1 TetR family transcriptional regulator [Streptomyces californicus]QRV45743.1 TetR family transcriptional regulator [Streptomyces californicus]QRV52418.1 TetR family transcriptional regulator [Streptomyces californicus]
MREVLAQAAFQLFLERGFERTTVDDIVARAGVGRRSFFRYFPSKEDAVFPDHESCLAEMTEFLSAVDDGDPVGAVCDAARIVLRMYADNPEFSVQRYRLTREVPGLRTYELSVVRRYEQTLAGHLRNRFGEGGDGALRAEVIAASVVAAHNNGLRLWLRSGGEGDPEVAVDHALALVREVWGSPSAPVAPAAATPAPAAPFPASGGGGGEDEVIVMVARKGTPMWRVVQQIEAAVAEN